MADFGDPYAAAATNPYLQMMQPQAPDWRMVLANMATGIGTGLSQAGATGQGWAAGLAPGIMYGNQLTGMQQQNSEQQAMKRWQLGMMAQEYAGKQQDRMLKLRAQEEDAKQYLPPGMRAPQPTALLGPRSYDTKLAGYEGGSKNGGMVFNELGSGAGGPYQIMPATWQDIRAKNPDLNLPEVMPVDSRPETRAMHDAAHSRFKAANAQALQAAGFEPTPENLYLAHRFGVGGATSVLRADPNKPLIEILPPDWQRQNPDMRGQTAGGFRRLATERMGGASVPYEVPQNAQPTQYALQPNALPSFDDPTLSLAPRPNSRFMPGVLPNTDSAPSFTAPVMPQPQATMTPAQFTPPPAAASNAPPQYVPPPRPELPEDAALSIHRRRRAGAITAAEARAEAEKIIDNLHKPQVEIAQKKYEQAFDIWKHERSRKDALADRDRSEQVEGEWVRGADGRETFVPKAQRTPGMVRHDKPPEAGTEAGDYRVLTEGSNTGKTDTREYSAAYNRIKGKTVDIGNGQRLPPDMRSFKEPTFKEAQDRPAPAPIGERERKFTEVEGKDYGFATRLANSLPQLEKMLLDDAGKYSTKRLPSSSERVKMQSNYYPDSWLSEDTKEFRRLSVDVVTAILRKESGGAITMPEFPAEYQKYIPQPGDSEKEIKAKLKSIRIIGRTYAEGSGRKLDTFGGVFDPRDDDKPDAPIRIDLSGKRK